MPNRFVLLFLSLITGASYGQITAAESEPEESEELPKGRKWVDTSFVSTYPSKLTGRVYMSQKYSRLHLITTKPRLPYLPNTSLNLGVGVTYRSVSLNLAYGFPFLNPHNGKGDTRYLDLQSHLYGRNWVTDVYGQFYKGYYLKEKGMASADKDAYYQRPDLYLRMVGTSVYHLFNGHRFSCRAAFVQNEWQKRSSGSWLAGAELYAGTFGGDSTVVPGAYSPENPVRKVQFYKFGPGGGYAYSWVLNRHFFATFSLTGNLNLTFSREFSDNGRDTRFHVRPNLNYRAVIGYNSPLWNVSLSMVNSDVALSGDSRNEYLIRTGNYRLTFARRFPPGRHLRRLAARKPLS